MVILVIIIKITAMGKRIIEIKSKKSGTVYSMMMSHTGIRKMVTRLTGARVSAKSVLTASRYTTGITRCVKRYRNLLLMR